MSDYIDWFLNQVEGRINAITAGRMFPDEYHHAAIVEDELQHASDCLARMPDPGALARVEELRNSARTLPTKIEHSRSELIKTVWGELEQ